MGEQRWSLDVGRSQIGFSVRHMVVARVRGRFTRASATLRLDELDLGRSQVEATIETASLDTGDATRDAAVRSADFLDVARFPALTFTSSRLDGRAQQFRLGGTLTIRGVSRPVTLEIRRLRSTPDELAYRSSTVVTRADFGLKWSGALEAGGMLVGEQVEVELELVFVPVRR